MTVQRRVLYPDGGFMLDGYVWTVDSRGWMTFDKRPVFVVVDQADNVISMLYADRACTERLCSASRGPKL